MLRLFKVLLSLVMCMPKYLTVDFTGTLRIVLRGESWIGNTSHFLRFNFKPNALPKKKSIVLITLGIWSLFLMKMFALSASWLIASCLPRTVSFPKSVFLMRIDGISAAAIKSKGEMEQPCLMPLLTESLGHVPCGKLTVLFVSL